jgi:hypothetical protein
LINVTSDTWIAVESTLKEEKERAINALIADRNSEKQRGKIELIDKILKLSKPKAD